MNQIDSKQNTTQQSSQTYPLRATSLPLAIILSIAAFSLAFIIVWQKSFGLSTLSKITVAFDHPSAILNLFAEAAGGSVLLPLIHMAIASLFKSKRNPNSRRKIFIGWGIFIILLNAFTLFTQGNRIN